MYLKTKNWQVVILNMYFDTIKRMSTHHIQVLTLILLWSSTCIIHKIFKLIALLQKNGPLILFLKAPYERFSHSNGIFLFSTGSLLMMMFSPTLILLALATMICPCHNENWCWKLRLIHSISGSPALSSLCRICACLYSE